MAEAYVDIFKTLYVVEDVIARTIIKYITIFKTGIISEKP
jgi:hypothetical protein